MRSLPTRLLTNLVSGGSDLSFVTSEVKSLVPSGRYCAPRTLPPFFLIWFAMWKFIVRGHL